MRFGGGLGAISLGGLFPSVRLFGAEQPTENFFVLIRTFGGMDVTLGLDPQILPAGADDKDLFLEYRPADILKAAGLRLGPAAAPLVPHAADSLIVNGIMMRRDAGHDVGNTYMATGRGDGKAASLPIELALAMGAGPYGVVMNGQPYLAGKAAVLSAISDIKEEAKEGTLIELIEERLRLLAESQGSALEEAEKKLIEGKAAAQSLAIWLAKLQKEYGKIEDRHVLAASFGRRSGQAGAVRNSRPDRRARHAQRPRKKTT